jgi:hypothetical protein
MAIKAANRDACLIATSPGERRKLFVDAHWSGHTTDLCDRSRCAHLIIFVPPNVPIFRRIDPGPKKSVDESEYSVYDVD